MALIPLRGVYYCSDHACHSWYTWDGEGENPCHASMLPCGHSLSKVAFSATCIKGGDEAQEMINWLMERDYIDINAFNEIEMLGGRLDDGLNCRVPEEK